MTKDEFREIVRKKRKEMGPEQIAELSTFVIDSYTSFDFYKEADVLMVYFSKPLEVNTKELIKKAIADGKTVAVPKLFIDELGEGYMLFVTVDNDTEYTKSKYGFDEPVNSNTFFPDDNAKVEYILPGLAFDLQGSRIGYGGGYYDRYLYKYDPQGRFHKVALCFDFQVFDELPTEEHDKQYDVLLSENRLFIRS